MSSFTVRVQLPGNPSEEDYEKLHQKMEAADFSRTIISNDGIEYRLPHAEYNIAGDYDRGEVLNLAADASKNVSTNAEIFVTESAGRTWRNLGKV